MMAGVVTFSWARAREDGLLRGARHDRDSARANQKSFSGFF
jgi:hypothetical protein